MNLLKSKSIVFLSPNREGTLSEESVPVTSEGLGSSDFSVPVSVDEPVRRPQIPGLIKPPGVIPNLASTTLPEDDILFQWRLRRKMEKARDWAQSQQQHTRHGNIFSWQPSVSFNPPGGEQDHPCKVAILNIILCVCIYI